MAYPPCRHAVRARREERRFSGPNQGSPLLENIAYYLCVILTFLCVIAGSLGLMLLFKELIID